MSANRSTWSLLWLLVLANALVVIAVCMVWIDRPLADRINLFMQRQWPLFDWTSRGLGLVPWLAAPAAALLLGAGVWRTPDRALPGWMVTPLLASWSLVGALAAAAALKNLVGRSQVYPPWIERREYGFHPFSGAEGYGAFPSATMAVAGAVLSVVWLRAPRLRVGVVLLGVAIAAAILLTNGHWLSDILGGALVGVFNGWMTVRILKETPWPMS